MGKEFIKSLLFFYIIVFAIGCNQRNNVNNTESINDTTRVEKFEPPNGKAIVFVGQELEAIGGTDQFNDGYYNHFPAAGGFTAYTSFLKDYNAFGYIYKGLDGLTSLTDWGDGPENMSLPLSDPDFKNSCLAIGLDISQGNDSLTATGKYDSLIIRLGNFLKALANRPVFLRVGYEFDGFDWNHYKPEYYIPAFHRVRHLMDSMNVTNVAYVWQSKGANTTMKILNEFYPGDDYVDWCAYSYFTPAEEHHPMIQFARQHKKPLFIAESSPVFLDSNGICKPLDLSKPQDAEKAWKDWFIPYFRTINDNPDVIKAFHYINSNWKSRPMWKNNPYFKNIDARLHLNDTLANRWKREISKEKYLNASDTLFNYLWNKK